MADEPTAAADTREEELPQAAELELRERLVALEDSVAALGQVTQLLALGLVAVALGVTLLVIVRARAGAR